MNALFTTVLLIKGMALGLYDRTAPFATQLGELRELGATHVSLVVSWKQHDVRATEIRPDANGTLPDDRLRELIRGAHEKGLKVLLFPILELEVRRPLEWRGTLVPRDVDAWWTSYEKFILHYAAIAAAEKVELYSVGSELVSTEAWRDRWYHLISRVRERYAGPLLYSANWDHYEPVSFWPRLDYMGVTAYNELTRDPAATEEQLAASWGTIRGKLAAFSRKIGKPLILTEIGYTSQDGAAVHPWDYTSRAGVDLEEQRRCYAAFVRAWRGEPALEGVFWWMWYGTGGIKDTGYTPKGKPAEAVLRKWYAE